MPSSAPATKPGSLKDPDVAILFSTKDPEHRYEDLREIGHGSFGAVFFALDKETKQAVAIKRMAFSGAQAQEKWNDIIREVRFLRSIRHRHIVEYRNCYLKEQSCWLVMEYCIGSAADIVEVHKQPILECEISAICEQTLLGLRFIHSKNRIHRDIKAGNILLTDTGTVKLADLGSASLISPAQSFVGTPYWMAPEVILAMDEGQYDERADIWSFGITCIELAERRPPLFKMNAMSALYHIAQNDPPSLSATLESVNTAEVNGSISNNCAQPPNGMVAAPWTERFRSFVEGCLRKDPQQRLSTAACLQHSFITETRRPPNGSDGGADVLLELIQRTKDVVRELDQSQYKRMSKLIYLDANETRLAGQTDSSSLTNKNACNGDEIAELLVGDSTRAAVASNMDAELISQNSEGPSRSGTLERSPGGPAHQGSSNSTPTMENRTLISVGGEVGGRKSSAASSNATSVAADVGETPTPTHSSFVHSRPGRSQSIPASNIIGTTTPAALQGIAAISMLDLDAQEKINTLRWSKFSTLRPTKVISREVEEYKRDDNIYEQMVGYKRLRQQHHKELQQLEERRKMESVTLQQRQDREYDQLLLAGQKELQKVHAQKELELDRQRKENEEEMKKFRKRKLQAYEHEQRGFIACQRKAYRYSKERMKSELKERRGSLSKAQLEAAIQGEKVRLKSIRHEAERSFAEERSAVLETELTDAKHRALLQLYALESRLLTNEWNIKARQMEVRHALLNKHHDVSAESDMSHFRDSEAMKKRHMEIQHQSEVQNQTNYTKRTLDEIKKQHALQCKQQPRELKSREMMIRKQFRQAVKCQARQFKAYQAQILQSVPKEEQKDLIARLKDEQRRKIAALDTQYENTIQTMISEQTVKLEAWQEEDIKSHSEKLQKELAMLTTFQERQRLVLCAACERERVQLQDRTNLRLSVLEQKMKEELLKFEQDKARSFKQLSERKVKGESELLGEKSPLHQSSVSSSSQSSSSNNTYANHIIHPASVKKRKDEAFEQLSTTRRTREESSVHDEGKDEENEDEIHTQL